jgi:myo-inositol-1(or 4)-monophosphatase
MSDYLSVCEESARRAGAILLDWVGRFKVRSKGPSDLVTEADLAAQQAIREVVLENFPDHGFVGEEGERVDEGRLREFCWIVDPLDGTANYAHGVPHFAVSVGLLHAGRLQAGVVFDPMMKECFAAEQGHGATLNGQPLRAAPATDLSEVLVATGFPPHVEADLPALRQFPAVMQKCLAIRRSGSAALNLAYLAAGRFGAYWAAELHPWDAAAGALLVSEAGGRITSFSGQEFDVWDPKLVAACTPEVHGQLLDVLRNA